MDGILVAFLTSGQQHIVDNSLQLMLLLSRQRTTLLMITLYVLEYFLLRFWQAVKQALNSLLKWGMRLSIFCIWKISEGKSAFGSEVGVENIHKIIYLQSIS